MEKKIDKASETWLSSQKKTTYWAYKTHIKRFVQFTGLNGDEILADRKKDKEFKWEAKLLEFKTWLMEEQGLNSNSAASTAQAIRGFFAFHRANLVFQRRETRKLNEHARKTEDYRFSLEDLRKMDEVADLQERYVVRAGKTFGFRAGDFLRLTRGDLEPYVKGEPPISIGTYQTQKEGVAAYPFIDSDAASVIRLILEKMVRDGRTKQTDRILEFKKELQLSRVLRRLVERAGINVGTKRVRFHCLRKFLCDHLSSHMSESKWKQVVGKKISEGAYISPDELRKDYERAMVETCFSRALDDQARQAARQEFERIFTPEQKEFIQKHGVMRFRRDKEPEKNRKEEACPDGKNCAAQQIVTEENLAGFLSENWKVTAVLPSGKVVIQRA